jgi:hypothetical protein
MFLEFMRRRQGEQNYTSGIAEWMRNNPDLMEQLQRPTDPNMELDMDNPSPWSLRYNPLSPI